MKWRNLVLILIALSFVLGLFAEATRVEGGGNFGNVTVESIDGAGLVKLNGTKVLDKIQMIGSLISQNSEIGYLDVKGEANLTETKLKNGGLVIGSIQTVRSTIEKPITILSQKSVFTNSKLAGITVKQDSSFKGKQIVELRLGTLVDGPIHFESGKGEVLVYPNSQVLGAISGGKVVKKN